MSITERATVAVFGVLLASIFGVLLAWIFLVTAVTVGTDDKGKTGASAEKIEIIRVRIVPITIPWAHFMLIDRDDKFGPPVRVQWPPVPPLPGWRRRSSSKTPITRMPGVARVAGLDLLDVEAIKLPAQFLGAYCSTRLSPLVRF